MARSDYTPRHGARRPRHQGALALVRRPVVGSAIAVGMLTTMGAAVATGQDGPDEAAAPATSQQSAAPASLATADVADVDRLAEGRREANSSRSASREQDRIEAAAKKRADARKAKAKKAADARKRKAASRAAERRKQAKKADWLAAVQKDPKPYAVELMREAGFGDDQWGCLETLWIGESDFEWDATNPSSGAYGIPQSLPAEKMASAGADWKTNPVTQMEWGIDYIKQSYGSPCEALNFWNSQNPHWY